jgi:hypothetical protein
MKYFTYDHNGEGFEYHNTKEDAKRHAEELLDFYSQNDDENNVDICWGEIKQSVHTNDAELKFTKVR